MINQNHYLIIDNRMRRQEKDYLKSFEKYKIIEIPKSSSVYEEISSHTDIFITKIGDNTIICEPSLYDVFFNNFGNINRINFIKGDVEVKEKYPLDIPYNVCVIGNYAIHNFKYTSKKIIDILNDKEYNFINIKQGYSNCSIAVIDDNSLIVNDKGIYNILSKYNFNILFIENELDIKLFKTNNKYSDKKGFIGGSIARIDNKIIIFGDLNKIDKNKKIYNFINQMNLQIVDFKGLDVIDYGGIVVI